MTKKNVGRLKVYFDRHALAVKIVHRLVIPARAIYIYEIARRVGTKNVEMRIRFMPPEEICDWQSMRTITIITSDVLTANSRGTRAFFNTMIH
jgi:hypothetical protein